MVVNNAAGALLLALSALARGGDAIVSRGELGRDRPARFAFPISWPGQARGSLRWDNESNPSKRIMIER